MSASASGEVISLAQRLKQRREQLGLSQAQAARELDVARTAYRLWEMEAAKPQPDRWRLISRWLGVSVTTMLMADELDENLERGSFSAAFERVGREWDENALSNAGELFSALHRLIQEGTEKGFITSEHAEELLELTKRVERDGMETETPVWEPGHLRKQLVPGPRAPKVARDALDVVAGDLPLERLRIARLLVSELVTNSVTHGTNTVVGLDIDTSRERLRVEVRDDAEGAPRLVEPGSRGEHGGGWGLMLVEELASRWATERENGGNLTWFELDLPSPGAKPAPL